MYETFDHTADLGLRIRAASLPELFADAAAGLASIIVERPEALAAQQEEPISLRAAALDYLLFDWLSELLFRFERTAFLPARCEIRKIAESGGNWELEAVALGESADADRHGLDHEVKAITYHGLKVERQPEGSWLAEVIVDI